MIDRRDLLRAVGAALGAAALAPLTGCRSGGGVTPGATRFSPDRVRGALRAAVSSIGAHLALPTAFLLDRHRVRALVDVAVTEIRDQRQAVAVLAGVDRDGRRIERCFDVVSPERIEQEAARLITDGPAVTRDGIPAIPPAIDHGVELRPDPATLSARTWLDRTRALAARAERVVTSRIVYRAAWMTGDDDRVWVVSETGDLSQRLIRTRIGASFVAWHGTEPIVGEAALTGMIAPDPDALSDDELARATAEALALATPGAPPAGEHAVALSPDAFAAILAAGLDAILDAPPGAPAPAALLVIGDDAGARPGLGSYWFDDTGAAARPTPLIAGGAVIGRLGAGHLRRSGPRWRLAPAPSNLVVAPGTTPIAELVTAIGDGLVVDGVRDVRIDPDGNLAVWARRTGEIAGGRRTGRAWDDVELRGGARALLAAVSAVSSERRTVEVAGPGPAGSVTAPWILTRCRVGSARGAR